MLKPQQIISFSLLFFVLVPIALGVGIYIEPPTMVGLIFGIMLGCVWIAYERISQ